MGRPAAHQGESDSAAVGPGHRADPASLAFSRKQLLELRSWMDAIIEEMERRCVR